VFHPIFEALVHHRMVERVSVEKGISFDEARAQIDQLPPGQFSGAIEQGRVNSAVALPPAALQSAEGTGKIFDGHLLQQFRAWLKTPQGQMFLKVVEGILMAMLLAMIMGS
jgi:hypothetical protein